MARVAPTPALVHVDGEWIAGVIRPCEVTADGRSCSAVVSYGADSSCVTTRRLPADRIRGLDGTPGCPVLPLVQTC